MQKWRKNGRTTNLSRHVSPKANIPWNLGELQKSVAQVDKFVHTQLLVRFKCDFFVSFFLCLYLKLYLWQQTKSTHITRVKHGGGSITLWECFVLVFLSAWTGKLVRRWMKLNTILNENMWPPEVLNLRLIDWGFTQRTAHFLDFCLIKKNIQTFLIKYYRARGCKVTKCEKL